jgi:hypothetical protein
MGMKEHSPAGQLKVRTTNATTKPGDVLTVAGFKGPVQGIGTATFAEGEEVIILTNSPPVFEVDVATGAASVAVDGTFIYTDSTGKLTVGAGDATAVQAYPTGAATAFVVFK